MNAYSITTDTSNSSGQVTTKSTSSNTYSGTFYLADHGGRGFADDAILMIASDKPLTSNFSITVQSTGYTWTPPTVNGNKPTSYTLVTNAVNESFGASDFTYTSASTQYRPGTGSWSQPFYYGESTSGTTPYYYMFVDLKVGTVGTAASGLANNGDVQVNYTINGLYSDIFFDMYAWCLVSNTGNGVNWTNNTAGGANTSGYSLDYTGAAYTPTPVPPSLFLLLGGFGGLGLIRRRWLKR